MWQFEQNNVKLLKEQGATVSYASDFRNKVYEFDTRFYERQQISTHHISIQKSPCRFLANTRALVQLVRILRREHIDLIHCHNPMGGVLGRLAAAIAGTLDKRDIKVIYTAHGFHFYQGAPKRNWLLYYPVERFLARYTDVLITINREDKELADTFRMKENGYAAKIPGVGVDHERFYPCIGKRNRARKLLGIKEGELCLMTAALLHREKNYQTVLQALEQVRYLPVRYVICGEGAYRKKLEQRVEKLHLEHQVTFLGFCKDMEDLLPAADLFLFPSLREGLGMAALEAMACGIPVIAADNRGTREYLREGENGVLCRGEVPEDFAKAIERLSGDGNLRKTMQTRCVAGSRAFGKEESRQAMKSIYQRMWEEWKEDERQCQSQCDHECLPEGV